MKNKNFADESSAAINYNYYNYNDYYIVLLKVGFGANKTALCGLLSIYFLYYTIYTAIFINIVTFRNGIITII